MALRVPSADAAVCAAGNGSRAAASAGGGARQRRGAHAYHTGRAAEDIAERHYIARGHRVLERRWRGQGGEIDLILENGAGLIFVEVKASEDFALAAEHLGAGQMARIYAAASEYLARMPAGQETEVRFDAALVDGAGRIEVIEAAFGL